jgi:hypothetical protein
VFVTDSGGGTFSDMLTRLVGNVRLRIHDLRLTYVHAPLRADICIGDCSFFAADQRFQPSFVVLLWLPPPNSLSSLPYHPEIDER